MADPLRRTLLAKLRGKKSKKGATLGGGYGSAAAAADGGREGKEKVLQTQRDPDEARPVLLLRCAAERMSTYENCADGPVLQTGGVVLLREQARSGGGSGNEALLGVSLQRGAQFGGHALREGDGGRRGPGSGGQIAEVGPGGAHVQRTRFVSVPRQRSVGDSIGFGDNSNHVSHRARLGKPPGGRDGEGTEPADRAQPRYVEAALQHDVNRSCDSGRSLEASSPDCAQGNTEENILIRNVESYGPEYSGDIRGALQSPTFFPTELEICDFNMASLCASEGLRYASDSEDEDYYDNEILPFYETVRAKSDNDRAEVVELAQRGQLDDSSSAQETDRLRNQLKEAYYLLINAMNDINLDVQQISGGLTERQATSSCSSHSRDSLCSRLSVKNMDSDSWSSGGEHSPQQVSDTDSLLLCLSGNLDSGLTGRLDSKSLVNLSPDKVRPTLLRSASDGAIKYPRGPSLCVRGPGTQSPESRGEKGSAEAKVAEGGKAAYEGELSDARTLFDAISSDELPQDAGGDEDRGGQLNESSGSVNSLTGSSDSNAEASAHQGQDNKQELAEARAQGANSVNKGHGVTVNKMQEWMHKGRLLSSEMKQRIEGSPRGGGQSQDRPCPQAGLGVQASGRGIKPNKAKSPTIKSPRQQQPAFIENVQTPCANGREVGRANEPPSWRPPLHTITVSKKRNWLQQSSLGKNHCTKEELPGMLGAEEEGSQGSHQPPPPPSPSPDHLRPSGGAPPRPVRLHLPQISVGQAQSSPHPRSVDPAEENDADDEGEIWYNPIPEDEEPEMSQRPSIRLLVPSRAEPQRRPSRGGDVGHGGRNLGGGGGGPDALGESLCSGGGSGDGSQGNAAHSTEALHLHRQMLACKPQEEGGPSTSRATDGAELPNAVSSPPSSPNPTKKSSSINWSFPDKIKSPRTVRKISMKMKKLPELSRKLSVKGTTSGSSSSGGGQLEPRVHSPRNNGSGSEATPHASGPPRLASSGGGQASRNVISRYHLDSSVSTQHSFSKKKSNGSSKSASKGGYLSDGDSPELVAKSGKHGSAEGKGGKGKEADGGGGSSKLNGTELDIDAFRHYSFTEQPKCSQYISGLMSLHFYGAEDLKPPRIDSRDVYCAIQVDSVNKARTALLTCRTTFLDMDHTFNIELENAQHLKLVVFSWEPTPRRITASAAATLHGGPAGALPGHALPPAGGEAGAAGADLRQAEPDGAVEELAGRRAGRRPGAPGVWRGGVAGGGEGEHGTDGAAAHNQVVGLYRLCGSAAVKKELREAFERDSYAVELCENAYPDVNVITGVLKDYLRELPYPLITKSLYEAVLEAMATRPLRIGASGCENDQADSEHTVSLLDNLPEVERMTLRRLLDHLKLVASYQEVNKMTCQNLAVCFGPVLLSQRQDASCHTNRVFIDSEELASALHFKKHIEVLHYLLQLWPVVDPYGQSSSQPPAASSAPASSDLLSAPPLRRRKERPQVLNLSEAEIAGVLRPRPGRLDSPSNRYAGDWSRCGESYFPSELLLPPSKEEADYDDVPSEDTEAAEEGQEKPEDAEEDKGPKVKSPASDPVEQEEPQSEEVVKEEEKEAEEEEEEEKQVKTDSSGNGKPLEDKVEEERVCDHILPPRLPKEHTYQAYMKIQDISPVLSNRVNLRDLQESIDTLIGNLERELNKNKLNVGY
ncbi:hypothetical protein L3Q82_025553 [Scortum barcoo]|uniref:Uncharacterized protein n=1 Tax=Scortum barcoo TaxID=214431 RepID=A0ACB8WLJ7_9TELE|nr:hypothetical protein L3Q82_025553 [Scortum barcoo]